MAAAGLLLTACLGGVQRERQLDLPAGFTSAVAFSPSGDRLYVLTSAQLHAFTPEGERVATLPPLPGLQPTDAFVYATDGFALTLVTRDGACVLCPPGNRDFRPVSQVVVSADGSTVVGRGRPGDRVSYEPDRAGTSDVFVLVPDEAGAGAIARYLLRASEFDGQVWDVAVSPDGGTVAVATSRGLLVFDGAAAPARLLEGLNDVGRLHWLRTGPLFGSRSGGPLPFGAGGPLDLLEIDTRTGESRVHAVGMDLAHAGSGDELDITPDGRYLFGTTFIGEQPSVLDLQTGAIRHVLPYSANAFTLRPDGTELLVVVEGSRVEVHDVRELLEAVYLR